MAEFYNEVYSFRTDLKEVKLIIPFFLKNYNSLYKIEDFNDIYRICEKIVFYCMVDGLNSYTYDSDNPKFPNQNVIKAKVKQLGSDLHDYNTFFMHAIKTECATYISKPLADTAVSNLTDCILELFINKQSITKVEDCLDIDFDPNNQIFKANNNKTKTHIESFYQKITFILQNYFYDELNSKFAFDSYKELLSYFKVVDFIISEDTKFLDLSLGNVWKENETKYLSFKNSYIDQSISPDIISTLKMTTKKVDINPLLEYAINSYKDKEEREKKQEQISSFKLSKMQKLDKLDRFRHQFEDILKLEACSGAEKKMDDFFADIPNKNSKKIIALIRKGLNNVGIYDENKTLADDIEDSINRELESDSDE